MVLLAVVRAVVVELSLVRLVFVTVTEESITIFIKTEAFWSQKESQNVNWIADKYEAKTC
jgi:hypothetical protein